MKTSLTPVCGCLGLLLAAHAAAGLVGYWSFDEGCGTVAADTGGMNNHGALVGGPLWTTDSWRGRALWFDGGDDRVQVAAPNGLPIGNAPRTVALWAKWSGQNRLTPFGAIAYQSVCGYGAAAGYGTPAGQLLTIERGAAGWMGKLVWFDWSGTQSLVGSTVDAFPGGEWVHVAFTHDGSTTRLWRNGVLEDDAAYTLGTIATADGFLIGACPPNDGYHGPFRGVIDEVRLYDHSLGEAEIQSLLVQPAAPAIRSAGTVEVPLGLPASYQIEASGEPHSFSASGLPAWFQLDPATGTIIGTPTASGTTLASISATGPGGTATALLEIRVVPAMPGYGITGCVGYWSFDEGAGAIAHDTSGSGNDGTLNGGAAWTGAGKRGGAITLDGIDDVVRVASPAAIPLGNSPRTLAAWVKWSGTECWGPAPTNRYQCVFGYGTWGAPHGWFALERGGDSYWPKLVWFDYGAAAAGTAPDPFPAGQWVHVAVTCNGSVTATYLNGQLEASAAGELATVLDANGFLIGSCPPGDGWHSYFSGTLDEVCVFNRVLTSAEIATLIAVPADAAPALEAVHAGANVLVRWPATAAGWTLETTATPEVAASWTTVAPPYPSTEGFLTHPVTPGSNARRFFRLRAP